MSAHQTHLSEGLLARDARTLWHPYAPAGVEQLYAVRGARGAWLDLEDREGQRREAIDAMGSWWSLVHGHAHPRLVEAIQEQAAQFPHVMFGGLTHEPAVRLAERLVELAPEGLEQVFLADSGSISVEVALKAALQFQAARGERGRTRMLSLRGGYHGDTFATMAVCDPVDGMHAAFADLVPEHVFAPRPPAAVRDAQTGAWQADEAALSSWAEQVRALAADHAHELAAVIAEPVLQGAGGMYVYAPEALRVLREVCDEHGLLLILDEIATGFGRTGRFFASEWAGISPDILCVGKALTGGTMTGAAMLCTREVAETVSRRDHGITGCRGRCCTGRRSWAIRCSARPPWPPWICWRTRRAAGSGRCRGSRGSLRAAWRRRPGCPRWRRCACWARWA